MRHLLVIAAISALALAKPEFYKEKEDFQYSRSSSDEGSKSGFYGAQRGNMGGNYEKAHNMDGLAQHQMSGIVRNVEGELGDGYKMKTGSVYSAANSRGIYGSGNYDLSNLQGRNFEETESFDNSHSSMTSQGSGFRSQSRLNSGAYSGGRAHSSGYRGYQAGDLSQQYMQTGNLQSADNLQSAHRYGYGSEAAQYSSSGYHSQHEYDQSSANLQHSGAYGSNSRSRILTTAPVRIVVRPGSRVTVPLTAQAYDADHTATAYNLDHSNINREAELVNTDEQQASYRPSNTPKHYESTYSYHKEWEKHNTQPINVPVAIPTENPFPAQSETRENLENTQHNSNVNAYNAQASNTEFTADTQSSSQARYQAGYNTKRSSTSSLAASTNEYNTGRRSTSLAGSSLLASNANEYNAGRSSSILASNTDGYKATNMNGYNMDVHGTNSEKSAANVGDSGNLVEVMSSKPKSYHSSYSYHKSWERQGDPYIIKPAGSGTFDGQASQKLTVASANHGAYSSHHYGSQYKQAHHSFSQNGLDSDCDEDGHIRVARSSNPSQEPERQTYQDLYQGQEEYGQQTQSRLENLEDLGQQTQNQWDNLQSFGQQEQSHWENSENLGQQIQSQWEHLQDLGQHIQQWDNMQHLGQQTEEKFDKLEDLGQQSQNPWGNIESQQTEQKFETSENMGQQIQNHWDNMQVIGQASGKLDKLEDLGQQTQSQWNKIEHLDQQPQNKLDKLEDLGQKPTLNWGNAQLENWQKLEDLNQHAQSDLEQQIQTHGLETPKMDSYGNEFDNTAQQEQGQWNVFDLNNTQDSQLTEKNDSGSNSPQKEDKELIRGPWSNVLLNFDGTQQENTNFHLNNLTPIQSSNKNVHDFDSSEIFHSQQTQNAWNVNQEEKKTQKTYEQNENVGLNANWHLQSQTEKSSHSQTDQISGAVEDQIDGKTADPKKNLQTGHDQNSFPLGSLWDKIDGIAKETLNDDDDDDVTQKSNNVDSTHRTQQESKPSVAQNTQNELHHQENTTSVKPEDKPHQHKNHSPKDVGRGDIGSDDFTAISDISEIDKTFEISNKMKAVSFTGKLNDRSTEPTTDKNIFNILTEDELKIVQDLRKKIENQISTTSESTTISTHFDSNTPAALNENEEKLIQQIRNKYIFNSGKEQITRPFNIPTSDIYGSNPMPEQPNHHQSHVDTVGNQENIGYEQSPEDRQNTDQQYEDFQQTQDLQSQSRLENFGQQFQNGWNSEDNLAQILDQQLSNLRKFSQKDHEAEIRKEIEEIERTTEHKVHLLTPPEPVTEKQGFWKSVGSKLTNAKNKVISWFSYASDS